MQYHQKFSGVFLSCLLSLILFVSTCEAFDWNAPRLDLKHVTRASIIDGKTNYTPVAEGTSAPYFYYLYINGSKIPSGLTGDVTLNLRGKAYVEFFKNGTNDPVGSNTYQNQVNLHLWEWPSDPGNYYIGNSDSAEANFRGSSESALSEQGFQFSIGDINVNGVTGKIRSTAEQMNKGCVPYVEFVSDDSRLSKIIWRFVNPIHVDNALYKNDQNDIDAVRNIRIRTLDGNYYDYNLNLSPNTEEVLQGEVDVLQNVEIENILFVQINFYFSDRLNEKCQTEFQWRFYPATIPIDTDPPGSSVVEKPSTEELDAAIQAIQSDLGIANQKIIPVDKANIQTTENVLVNNGLIDKVSTSSAIAVNQVVEQGGATVVATSITMPLNTTSFSGQSLPRPATSEEFKKAYRVFKTFPNGGQVDLLEKYPDLFTYRNDEVILNATLIIVDGEAPKNDARVDIYYERYGIMRQNRNGVNYLYIFDGNADGYASDPIALVANQDSSGDPDPNNYSGGSGGCNAGLKLYAFLFFAVSMIIKKK